MPCLTEHLNFTNNELGGTIPDELEDMVALQSLDFSRNNLVGQIPNELGDLGLLGEWIILVGF